MSKSLTIITTTYRAEKHLPLYFKGVLNLRGLDSFLFLIIMNEPSEEEKNVAYTYRNQYKDLFQIIEVPKRETIGASLNRGFSLINTPYCSFLDVDDIRVPDSYLRQIATLEQNPDVDFTYGDFIMVPNQGETQGVYYAKPEFEVSEFMRFCHASPTQCFRSELIQRMGGVDEQFLSGGDFDFQIRAVFNCNFLKTPGLICYYTKSPDRVSASSGMLQHLERTVIELRYGLYDKIIAMNDFPYIKKAKKYCLDQVFIQGEWKHIATTVSIYNEFMRGRHQNQWEFELAYILWEIYHRPVAIYQSAIRIAKNILKPIYRRLVVK